MEKKYDRGKKFIRRIEPHEFFYIAHISNLKSILEKGIYSHNLAEEKGLLLKEMLGMQDKFSDGNIDPKMMQKMAKKFRGKVKF